MSLPPNLDLSRFVNNVKTTSSRLVRREFGNSSKRLSQADVLVPVVLHHLMGRRTAVGDQAICRAAECVAECAGVTFGPSPEAAFTKPWLSPRVEHWRQFGSEGQWRSLLSRPDYPPS